MLGTQGLGRKSAELHRVESLTEVRHLIDEHLDDLDDGWSAETARLYAIDVAMVVTRRHLGFLTDQDRQLLVVKLNEARRLVIDHRAAELEWIQLEFESHLGRGSSLQTRPVWLTAINAMLPSPYRAAVTAAAAALTLHPAEIDDLAGALRDRLRARLGEGDLHREESADLIVIV